MTLSRLVSRIALTCTALAMLAPSGCKKVPAAPATASGFTIVQGDNQTAQAGVPLPTPVVIRVIDATGDGIPNLTVVFAVATGGGTVNPASATQTARSR